ncbi:helix-turn-helix domain-containing protein [Streptosporangium sp. NPDC051022]|uniref:AraC family transcriptional regulator n=1 Tax=Streptosporangium sp. NPDC051022 TaxID=3155752 RepID=UPI003438584C
MGINENLDRFNGNSSRDRRVCENRHLHVALREHVHWIGYTGPLCVSSHQFSEWELPEGTVTLIVSLGDPLRTPISQEHQIITAAPPSFVVGLHERPHLSANPHGTALIRMDMTPLGAYSLLGVPMRELANTFLDLEVFFGFAARQLVDRLRETSDWSAQVRLLSAFLLERLENGPVADRNIGHAWRELRRTGGRRAVADLADDVGWNRRHLTRRFTEQVGLPPKTLARILRMQRALDLLKEEPHLGQTRVAADAGFSDQAHLIREFRSISGRTPTQFLRKPL